MTSKNCSVAVVQFPPVRMSNPGRKNRCGGVRRGTPSIRCRQTANSPVMPHHGAAASDGTVHEMPLPAGRARYQQPRNTLRPALPKPAAPIESGSSRRSEGNGDRGPGRPPGLDDRGGAGRQRFGDKSTSARRQRRQAPPDHDRRRFQRRTPTKKPARPQSAQPSAERRWAPALQGELRSMRSASPDAIIRAGPARQSYGASAAH